MIEFLQTIQVKPVFHNDEQIFTFDADTFSFEPSSSDDEGGMLYNCDHVFVIDTPDKDILSFFSSPRSAIVTLKDSRQNRYDIGTDLLPARVYLQPYLNRTRLYMSCRMPTNPLL